MISYYFAYLLINFLLILHVSRVILYEVYLWQLKEYRFDRMMAHLSTFQGKRMLINPINIAKWIILAINIIFLRSENVLLYLLLSLYIFETIYVFRKGIIRSFVFPIKTVKAMIICFLLFIITYIFILNKPFPSILYIQIFDRVLPLIIIIIIMAVSLISYIVKKIITYRAFRKISSSKNLTVIGITGSYGKTSTKEFLYSVLKTKYDVLKTEGSNNTEIGIAKTINNKLSPRNNIFIAEVGAYKIGEIAEICQFIKPSIGIITGINEQHIQLFGCIDNTVKAKFELINNLNRNGIAILNIGNDYIEKKVILIKTQKPDLKIYTYFVKRNTKHENYLTKKYPNSVIADNIKLFTNSTEFNLQYKDKQEKVRLKLIGAQNIENLLSVYIISLHLGLTSKQVIKAFNNLTAPDVTMKLTKIKGKNIIIDTFNANPSGVFSALEYIRRIKGRKVLVLTPLIELGKEADNIHIKLGEKAAEVCDVIILTNNNYSKSFTYGASRVVGGENKIYLYNKKNTYNILDQFNGINDVIIFQGKESGSILEELL
ncbi:hypothetical protein COV53_03095 [Candidatus Gottesmanbacteria bacterium CG11_big_fil_rev_8_21_14_0_20_37_11]|uniref:Mur ligase central domain-containing protein n=2 Tax=Candidatus Gottesmaniibacteriota TaxID=1752720 RepID=A0A2M7RRH4_9BACT|nr:MAG: hypothetical protein COV53_03095 [Candidatus Gottesmanbacteria bacterium CG11_big_fil_rev_8_21_14_0_20_37_11]PIZ02917.1 MAG: hypothetical protein COY59_02210 [Candidatus Gottesmanbacteria bacterium CG_4_10_14_0_8_um_filter_37_24]